MIHELSRV